MLDEKVVIIMVIFYHTHTDDEGLVCFDSEQVVVEVETVEEMVQVEVQVEVVYIWA